MTLLYAAVGNNRRPREVAAVSGAHCGARLRGKAWLLLLDLVDGSLYFPVATSACSWRSVAAGLDVRLLVCGGWLLVLPRCRYLRVLEVSQELLSDPGDGDDAIVQNFKVKALPNCCVVSTMTAVSFPSLSHC